MLTMAPWLESTIYSNKISYVLSLVTTRPLLVNCSSGSRVMVMDSGLMDSFVESIVSMVEATSTKIPVQQINCREDILGVFLDATLILNEKSISLCT